jgi:hypothetical protein
MSDDQLLTMRERADQCRLLAELAYHEKMKWQLLDWANEIEGDLARLDAERCVDRYAAEG